MNFKKLAFWTTLFTTAAVPLATAQNPTILQGNYISNVFGQANFVLNPNAQTNTANVTVSSATVTRSTTTPLVATSEFLVTTSTATGNIDWSTRTFDAGMKNQNCEARFTYKGFSVGTTTAQIRQGSNTVAQLTLTPSTDPRIASINFPCGDLSLATTFRLQQATASLTGTNEIGGIYVGLATNQANVAQAELIGTLRNYGANCIWTGAGTSAMAVDTDCSTYTKEGLDLQPTTRVPAITFTAPKSGNYAIGVHVYAGVPSVVTYQCQIYQNGVFKNNVIGNYTSTAATQNENRGYVQFNADLTSGTAYTFDVRCTTSALLLSRSVEESLYWTVYRFPSSSELVVTPERQNTFAGVQVLNSSGAASNTVSSAAWAKLTSGSALTRTVYGKAKVETNNDFSITIDNMPVGSYQVTASGTLQANSSTAAGLTECIFGLADSATGGAQIGSTSVNATGDTGSQTQYIGGQSFNGIYVNTSVATRTFYLQAYRGSGTGGCYAYTSTQRPFNITVTPLDQPSNSALYVQGPVKSAGTGDAIASGYVGEIKQSRSTVGCVGAGAYRDAATVTLTPGVWRVTASTAFEGNTFNDILTFISPQSGNVQTWRQSYYNDAWQSLPNLTAGSKVFTITPPTLVRYDGTNFYRFEDNTWKDAFASASGILYVKYYYAMNCVGVYSGIIAERVN